MFILIVWFSSFSASSRQCRVARISGRFGPVAISLVCVHKFVCVSEIIKYGYDGFPCHDTQTNQNRNHRKVFLLFVHEIHDNWNTTEVGVTQCLVNHSFCLHSKRFNPISTTDKKIEIFYNRVETHSWCVGVWVRCIVVLTSLWYLYVFKNDVTISFAIKTKVFKEKLVVKF